MSGPTCANLQRLKGLKGTYNACMKLEYHIYLYSFSIAHFLSSNRLQQIFFSATVRNKCRDPKPKDVDSILRLLNYTCGAHWFVIQMVDLIGLAGDGLWTIHESGRKIIAVYYLASFKCTILFEKFSFTQSALSATHIVNDLDDWASGPTCSNLKHGYTIHILE